jgi:hypothetical protein
MSVKRRIGPHALLRAQMRQKRQGNQRLMAELERAEPDLAEYALENLTNIYHRMLDLRAPARKTRTVYQQIESLVLICITAMRQDSTGKE